MSEILRSQLEEGLIITCDCHAYDHCVRIYPEFYEDGVMDGGPELFFIEVGHRFGDKSFWYRLKDASRIFWSLLWRRGHFSEWAEIVLRPETVQVMIDYLQEAVNKKKQKYNSERKDV